MANLSPYGTDFNGGFNRPGQTGDTLVDTLGNPVSLIGITGLRGVTGVVGPQGPTGINLFGATGIAGVQGITGAQGRTGLIGATGLIGETGLTNIGQTGLIGNTGIAGLTGVLGSLGIMGLQGTTGLTGTATGIGGSTGTVGVTGFGGLSGPTGIQGETGLIGPTGLQGETGLGLLGVTGAQGATGIRGATGINDLSVLSLQRQLVGATLLYVVPANTLLTNAQYLEFSSTVRAAIDGSPTTFTINFGGTTIFSDTINSSETQGLIQGIILRLGATSQECCVAATYSNGNSYTQRSSTTITLSSNQNIVTNVSNQAGGAIALKQIVKKLREP